MPSVSAGKSYSGRHGGKTVGAVFENITTGVSKRPAVLCKAAPVSLSPPSLLSMNLSNFFLNAPMVLVPTTWLPNLSHSSTTTGESILAYVLLNLILPDLKSFPRVVLVHWRAWWSG